MLDINTTHNFKAACALLADYYASNKAIYYQDVIEHYNALFERVSNEPELSIVVLHDSDLDGCTAGSLLSALFKQRYNLTDRLKIKAVTHGKPFSDCLEELVTNGTIGRNTVLIVADHALSYAHYKCLVNYALSTLWIDHHPILDNGAGDTVVDFTNFHVFHLNDSAAAGTLVFMLSIIKYLDERSVMILNPDRYQLLEYFVKIIDAYDTFRFHTVPAEVYQATKGINSWFRYGQHNPKAQLIDVIDALLRPLPSNPDQLAAYHAERSQVFEILKEAETFYGIQTAIMHGTLEKYCTIHDCHLNDETVVRIAFVLHSDNIDHLLAAALEKHSEAQFAIAAFLDKRGKYRLSIRSRRIEDDCNVFAQRFGGGGHAKAAGAGISIDCFTHFLNHLSFVH